MTVLGQPVRRWWLNGQAAAETQPGPLQASVSGAPCWLQAAHPSPPRSPDPKRRRSPEPCSPVPQQGSPWGAPVHASLLDTEALVRVAPTQAFPAAATRSPSRSAPSLTADMGRRLETCIAGVAGPSTNSERQTLGLGGPLRAAPSEKWWLNCSATPTPGGDTRPWSCGYLAEGDMPQCRAPRWGPAVLAL